MSVRIAVLCSECSYSKSAVCADGAEVCADCGAKWPSATDAQRATVDYFTATLGAEGSHVSAELDDGTVWITEEKSAQWDHERTCWMVRADGAAVIL